MTAYFDEVSSEISSGSNTVDDIIGIEQRVISHALLVCGDREFPDDLREEIMTIIAVNGIFPYVSHSYRERGRKDVDILVNENAQKYAEVSKSSKMLPLLHEAFHHVGERRIEARFGLLTDDPLDILRTRERWEIEQYGT